MTAIINHALLAISLVGIAIMLAFIPAISSIMTLAVGAFWWWITCDG